jgi:hypothetical protein
MAVQLTAILDLTEQVQAAIDRGDWSRARELEIARGEAIAQLVFERAADPQIGEALAELYARNQRLLGDVDRERRRLLRENALLKTGQAAVAAYDDARADAAT